MLETGSELTIYLRKEYLCSVAPLVHQGCCLTMFQGAQKGKSQNVRSPTGNVLGAAAKI